jgi:hypothetical protein
MRKSVVILLVIGAAIMAIVHIVGKVRWTQSYNQAEPLVQLVWPLAADMQEYYAKHGYNARALADVTSDPEKLALTQYSPVFTPDGTNIFKLTVNDSYGFGISSNFTPYWIILKK